MQAAEFDERDQALETARDALKAIRAYIAVVCAVPAGAGEPRAPPPTGATQAAPAAPHRLPGFTMQQMAYITAGSAWPEVQAAGEALTELARLVAKPASPTSEEWHSAVCAGDLQAMRLIEGKTKEAMTAVLAELDACPARRESARIEMDLINEFVETKLIPLAVRAQDAATQRDTPWTVRAYAPKAAAPYVAYAWTYAHLRG